MGLKVPKIVLVYHGVQANHPMCVPPDLFSRQMDYLARRCFVIPLHDLLREPGGIENRMQISVTFDDGYKNFIENALPVLKKHRISSTVYIPTGYIGEVNEWDRGLKGPLLPIMDRREITAIRAEGVWIGCHTRTHRRLADLSDAELGDEVQDSKKMLEDLLGTEVNSFSYPYGGMLDFDERAVALVEKAGYTDAVTTYFGRFNCFEERFRMRRITVLPRDPMAKFILELKGFYDWLATKERISYRVKRNFRPPPQERPSFIVPGQG